MEDLDKYQFREVFDDLEILNLLHHLKGKKANITLWQNINEERIMSPSTLININPHQKELTFFTRKKRFAFNSVQPVYFFHQNKFVIFKGKIILNSNFKLILKFPDEIISTEDRCIPRINLKKTVKFSFYKATSLQPGNLHFRSQLIDLSKEGLSFKLSKKDYHKLEVGDRLYMKFLGENKVDGRVAHINEMVENMMGTKYFRVGVKLEEPLELSGESYSLI